MLVQYFVIILICWSSSVHTREEDSCQHPGNYILSKSTINNQFTITFCNDLVFYEAVVTNSVELCTCNNGSSQPKCLGENNKWYDMNQVMSTIGDELDNLSLVQYCSGIGTPCCYRCNTYGGCTVNVLTQEMSENCSSLDAFFGSNDVDFY